MNMTRENLDDLLESLLETLYQSGNQKYWTHPIPSNMDDTVFSVLEKCVRLETDEKDYLISVIDEDAADVLGLFSDRMAALGVREDSLHRLFIALFALVIGLEVRDVRESLMCLSVVHHSVLKLGESPNELFEGVSHVFPRSEKFLNDFLAREPKAKSIAAMGYVEAEDSDGFVYKRDW